MTVKLDRTKRKKVLFLDLDGTIIESVEAQKWGYTTPHYIGDMQFRSHVVEAICNFAATFDVEYIWITSNQGGIEKGFMKESSFDKKLQFVCAAIEDYCGHDKRIKERYATTQKEIEVDGICCDANDPDDWMHKPNTGMLDFFIARHLPQKFHKREMIMVGDASGRKGQSSDSDKRCAKNFGIDYIDADDFINRFYENFTSQGFDWTQAWEETVYLPQSKSN
ncbi:MAG: hypothetical protein LBP59_10710 [Planctomycetaceae bacterium]|jgi:DNA 3'-phosphatase|nr:hypothetical protein [Planctomycetaceae bacterium]